MSADAEYTTSEPRPLILAAIHDDDLWKELSGPLHEHFQVRRETDGLRAIDVCLVLQPVGVIAETGLPGLSGILLARLISANRHISRLPVALVMSRDFLIEEFWANDSGAVATVPRAMASDAVHKLHATLPMVAPISGLDWKKAEKLIAEEGGPAAGVANELERQLIGASIIAKLADIETSEDSNADQTLGTIPNFIHKALSELSSVLEFAQAGVTLIKTNQTYMVENRYFSHFVEPGAFARETYQSGSIYFDKNRQLPDPEILSLPPIHREQVSPQGQASTFFALPLIGRDGVYGLLSLMTYKDIAVREYYLHTLSLIGSQLSVTLERAMFYEELRRLAVTDSLTGLSNRRAIFNRLDEEFSRSIRYEVPFSVAVCDLDDFKQLNDKHGHQAGDEMLRVIAGIVKSAVREVDLAGRWGGEEMALLFPMTDLKGAIKACERIREQVADNVVTYNGHTLKTTLSIGVATIDAKHYCPLSANTLVGLADSAMYHAKSLGKNKVASFLDILETKSTSPFNLI